MRRSGRTVPNLQDVCIFCSSPWMVAVLSRSKPQRRFFTSGHIVQRPLEAVAGATAQAQKEEKVDRSMDHGAFLSDSLLSDSFEGENQITRKQKSIKPLEERLMQFSIPEATGSIEATSQSDRLREERLAQTKNGRFVGFVAQTVATEDSPFVGFKPNFFARESDLKIEQVNENNSETNRRQPKLKYFVSTKGYEPPPSTSGSIPWKFDPTASSTASSSHLATWRFDPKASSSHLATGRFDPKASSSHLATWRFDPKASRSDPTVSRPEMLGESARAASTQYVKGSGREKGRRRSRFLFNDEDDDIDDKIEMKRQRKRERAARKLAAPPTPIILPEFISIVNLAIALRVPIERLERKMNELGFTETNHDYILDAENAGLIASEFNYEPTVVVHNENRDIHARPPVEDTSLLPPRPPVVTIMGHVDHGKTTLLDWLRKSSVAASEHGGITQHIGAFSVSMPSGRVITFLDTPGHAAFLSMRQRGANVTDIVILVVAADDSVKPQTLEALKHARAAKVPIVVAVNKVDKEVADVDRVKNDLARHGVEIEEYGGDTQVVPVSAKTGQGMLELEEAVIALADLLDVRAETDGAVEGWVLEATKGKAGRTATVLVSRGTIRPGVILVAGSTWAKARTLRDPNGVRIWAARPGTPVEIDGWKEQPMAGDQVLQANSEQQAKSAVAYRIEVAAKDQMATDMAAVNETRRAEQQKREQEAEEQQRQKQRQKQQQKQHQQQADEVWGRRSTGEESRRGESKPAESQPGIKEVFFIIKADVSGSVEAVLNSVSALGNSEVRPHILRSGVGPVTEFDIDHVATAGGYILSFNTVVEPGMMRRAEQAGVKIMNHTIIYRLAADVEDELSRYLAPVVTQRVSGEAEIAQIFEINIKRRVYVPIAGCKVRNGTITRKGKVRVMREGEVVYDGALSSLKHVKKNVAEMQKGSECGIAFENWTAFEVGDLVQCYEEKSEQRNFKTMREGERERERET